MDSQNYRVVRERSNGAVSVIQIMKSGKEQLEKYAKEKNGFIIHVDKIPDTTYRYAWVVDRKKKKIIVDARIVADSLLSTIRSIRNGKLAELDVPSIRALEDGDVEESKRIKARKQELRDLPEKVKERLDKIVNNARKRNETKIKELEKFKVRELEN
jgi:uncharacterized protein YktB (UPF0637 family)